MKTQLNRDVCLGKWANGDITFALSRFTHNEGRLIHHTFFFTKKLTASSVRRFDRVLQNYPGAGVRVSMTDERTFLTQRWEDLLLSEGETVDRSQYKSIEDLVNEMYPQITEKG